jgi:hypothetical protein
MLKQSFSFRLAVRGRAMAALFISGLSLSVLAGLAGCKAADFTGSTADTTQAAADSAVLRVTNGIEQDPGPVTLLLYSKTSMDLTNAVMVKKLGTVPFQGTVTMKVPVGTWKLGRENEAGVIVSMIDADAEDPEWIQCIFKKDEEYSLIFATDGNRTVWHTTFETIPALD